MKHKHAHVFFIFLPFGLMAAMRFLFTSNTGAVDPYVSFEESRATNPRAVSSVVVARLSAAMNGEVARTADREAEIMAMAFSSMVSAGNSVLLRPLPAVRGRLPHDVTELVEAVERDGLLPPSLHKTNLSGTLVSPWGSVSIRYRPDPLAVEIVSIASKSDYGPAMIVRLPDEENGAARFYVSGRLQGITIPGPFAPDAEVIALGWNPEPLRSLR